MNQVMIAGVQIALSIWEMVIFYQLLYVTMLEKSEVSRVARIIGWGNILVVGGLFGVNRLIAFFSDNMCLIGVFLTAICVWTIKRKKLFQIIEIVFLYFVILALLDFIFVFVSMELLGYGFVQKIYLYTISWWKDIIYFCSRVILYAGVFVIYKKKWRVRDVVEDCQFIIFVMDGVLIALLLKYHVIIDNTINKFRPVEGLVNSISLATLSVLVILGGIFIVKYRFTRMEKETLQMKEELLEERYKEMLKSRQMVHDLKNHLLALKKYEENGQWEELRVYLQEMETIVLRDSGQVWTGNQVVDLILNQKKKQAEEEHIAVEIETETFIRFPFKDSESVSVFGNLLDNAIEACRKMDKGKGWIRLGIKKQNQMVYIELENSFGERPDERAGWVVSSKVENTIRGFGLRSVKQIVEKYGGSFSYQIKESSFLVSILLSK